MVAALAAPLVGCTDPGEDATSSIATVAPATPVAPTAAVEVPVVSSALGDAAAVVPPTRLQIADIGVDMPVEAVGVDGAAQMALPVDPAILGWYRFGPDAVASSGHLVLSAHVDAPDYPIGPLARLRELSPGAQLVLGDANGSSRTYRVESVTAYDKKELPVDELFRRDGPAALVVITCGGPFDAETGRYRDNVVAVARPL